MALRLTHAIATGATWYGRWGYRFERGCYGHTAESYATALNGLRAVAVAEVADDLQRASRAESLNAILSRHGPGKCSCGGDLWSESEPKGTLSELLGHLMRAHTSYSQAQRDANSDAPKLPPGSMATAVPEGTFSSEQRKLALQDLQLVNAAVCFQYPDDVAEKLSNSASIERAASVKRWTAALVDCKWCVSHCQTCFSAEYGFYYCTTGSLRTIDHLRLFKHNFNTKRFQKVTF
eukprot:SAG31_NODE_1533_length_7989_cov_7.095691_4_plen_235_part_00